MDKGLSMIVLPVFFGHLLGSFAGLRVWLAVKGTPIVAKSYIETTSRSDGRNNTGLIAGVVASSLILLTVALGIGQVVFWPTLFNFVSGGVLMLPLTEAMFSCIYDLTSIRQTLYRHPDGMLRIDLGFPDDSSMTVWRKLGCSSRVVVAVCLPAVTLYYTSDIGASLLLFAITYALQSTHSHTVVFMREVICTAIGIHAALVWGIAFGLFIICYIREKPVMEATHDLLLLGGDHMCHWFAILVATIPPTSIISISLRLDSTNHASNVRASLDDPTTTPADLVPLQIQVPKIKWPSENLYTGVVIPYSLPFTFECPYFISTLLAWLLTNLAIMDLLARGWLSDFGLDVVFAHTFYVLVCALPVVLLSLVMVALVRGEVEMMWTYVELWQFPVFKIARPADVERNGEKI